jgi:hypothetical protein
MSLPARTSYHHASAILTSCAGYCRAVALLLETGKILRERCVRAEFIWIQ